LLAGYFVKYHFMCRNRQAGIGAGEPAEDEMDFALTDEQRRLQEQVSGFAATSRAARSTFRGSISLPRRSAGVSTSGADGHDRRCVFRG
jgi:hypothetical protein